MKKNSISLPSFAPEWSTAKSVDYEELLSSFKAHLKLMPTFVKHLKAADNQGWQQLLDDLAKHIEDDPNLSKFLRRTERNGVVGLSIGEPNWWVAAAAAAFGAGYAVGTACYRLGPCNFVR